MTDEYDSRYEKIEPLLHCQTPSLRIEVVRVGLRVIEVLEKDELAPGENKTYMGETISQYDQTCNYKNI